MSAKNINLKEFAEKIISKLNARQKEVILKRFGLEKNTERKTLEEIGKEFGVCRERIRQIEQNAKIQIVKQNEKSLDEVFNILKDYFKDYGFLRKEETIFNDFGQDNKNYLFFFLSLGKKHFKRFSEKKEFFPFWTSDLSIVERAKITIQKVIELLNKENRILSLKNILETKTFQDKKISEKFLSSWLEISKLIIKTSENHYGLKTWPEINPKKISDKIYLLFKQQQKPLHFKSVKELMPQFNLNTIHNELIKDKRFVLIGRGIYALSEWGYVPGKVKEVIAQLIKQQGRPLTKQEIVDLVLNQRIIKKFTIYQYLSDRKIFKRNSEGRYYVAEA